MISALVKQLIVDGIVSTASRTTINNSASVGLYALAGGISIIGVVFLAIAVYGLLLENLTMPAAASITGAGILALAGVFVLIGKYAVKKIARRRHTEKFHNVEVLVGQLLEDVLGDIENPIRENPKTAMILAGLAGFMAGDRLQ